MRLLLIRRRNVADRRGSHLFPVLHIELMPVLRRHLPLIRRLAGITDGLLVDDVQHDLRVHIPTGGTGTRLGIGIVGRLLKIGNGIDRITIEHGITATVEQPQSVEELIDIARRLVDIHHDQLTLQGLFLQQEDHLFRISRRESRRRLVEEEHSRFTYQFQRDVQTFPLTAGDIFIDGRTYLQVLDGIQSQVL